MINTISKALLIITVFGICVACKPLLENEHLASLLGQGTELVDGDYAPADHWEGRWRIVNVWAEWCKPCWQEIPELNQFYAMQDVNDVVLVGYNFDELEQVELVELKKRMKIQFPVLTQWPQAWQKPEFKGLPATLIINPHNQLQKVLWGPQTLSSLHQAINQVDKL